MGLYFQEVFGRYLWNCPSTLKIEENKMNFFSILGLIKSSPNSLGPPGTLWDPFGPPLGGPRGGIKVGVQKESCSDHYSEQLSCWTLTSFPPLGPSGPPRGVPEDSKWSQGAPENLGRTHLDPKLKRCLFSSLIFNVEGPFQRYLQKTSWKCRAGWRSTPLENSKMWLSRKALMGGFWKFVG